MTETGDKQTDRQFPGSDDAPKHTNKQQTTARILTYTEFAKDGVEKFNKQTIEKNAMSGSKTGDAGVSTLDEAITSIKKFDAFIADKQTAAEGDKKPEGEGDKKPEGEGDKAPEGENKPE